jgi:acyl carrier protein phosphodiesterase
VGSFSVAPLGKLFPNEPLTRFVARAEAAIAPVLPGAPADFIDLNRYLWSERWLIRYADMTFIASVLNGMANRRPKLAALRDAWLDLDENYDALETLFCEFYPQMMALARRKRL